MPRALAKLERWIESHGFELIGGRAYLCNWNDREISYRPQDPLETIIRGVLHECGHVLVERAARRGTRYANGYGHPHAGKARPNYSTADLVHEELEAWHRGYALAKRLHIRLDEAEYWRDYGACIKGYFRRAVARAL